MTVVQSDRSFYIVGGPVQRERPCYVARSADELLYARLRAGEYCHVLAPPHAGKTSLMAAVAGRLRAEGVRVATVDLAEIGSRDAGDDIGRWYYSVAYRIVRELRIRTELHTWWQDHIGLTNMQRLRAFFLEVVLESTEGPVVIFLDRIEATLLEPLTAEIFGAVRACYDARATEPEYERLCFALLGAVPAARLMRLRQDSPFEISVPVPLADFTPAEVERLAAGAARDAAHARELAARVFHWTSGQPYLSQKILRGVARRGDPGPAATAVDSAIRQLFLGPAAAEQDAHLAAISARLLHESARRVARLSLYGKIRKGGEVQVGPSAEVLRPLREVGLLEADPTGRMQVRNRIYAAVFTARWVNRNLPLEFTGMLMAAAAAALVILVPAWYTEYLPNPYVRELTTAETDFVEAADAHRRLGMLPGFGRLADRLFLDYLAQAAQAAGRLPEVQRIAERMGQLPGGRERAESTVAAYWDRRATTASLRGDRDAALLYRLEANAQATPERRRWVGQLLGNDYANLSATLRPREPLTALELDPERGLLVALDVTHRAEQWRISAGGADPVVALQLEAEEQLGLRQERVHAGAPRVRRLELSLLLDHARPPDVLLTLRSPAGRQASVRLPERETGPRPGEFHLDSRAEPALRGLLDGQATGTWTAVFADTRRGEVGALADWDLKLDGRRLERAEGSPGTAPIPEARVAENALSRLAPGGRRGLAYAAEAAVPGDVSIYDLEGGQLIASLPRAEDFLGAVFARGDQLVLSVDSRGVDVRRTDDGKLEARISGEGQVPRLPVLSDNGEFLVIDRVRGDEHRLEVWNLASGRRVRSLLAGRGVDLVAVDSGGRWLAVSDGDRIVRVWQVADGNLAAELRSANRPERVWFAPNGRWLAVEDAGYVVGIWELGRPAVGPLLLRPGGPWELAFAPTEDAVLLGAPGGFTEVLGLPGAQQITPPLHHGLVARSRGGESGGAQVRLTGVPGLAVTYDGRRAAKVWQIPAGRVPRPVDPGLLDARAALSPDGDRLFLGTRQGGLRVQSIGPGAPVDLAVAADLDFLGHAAAITAITVAASGALAATGAEDGTVRVWDAGSGQPRSFIGRHADGPVAALVIASDERFVVSVSRASVQVSDTRNGALMGQLDIAAESPRLAVAPGGEDVIVAGDRGGVTRWNWRDGAVSQLADASLGIEQMALSPGGELLVTAGADRSIRVWDLRTGRLVDSGTRAAAPVDGVWFASDADVLVRAKAWLHVFGSTPDGLVHRVTHRLPGPALAVQPARGSRAVTVLLRRDEAALQAERFDYRRGWGQPVEDLPPDFRTRLEARLNLTLTAWGDLRPLKSL